ncbi:cellulase family glycosylhydrolase [Sphingomonas kyeonggiensis]|uniref:Aryl-phospho-beta-D-glucosidase BglC (GH1 family) n=1 Tax=Sphingomonas kyeonggiensis TaxID=1268553 RepID=A0A7W6JWI3_9SPHN|nr:cellulase family glycosylhydrolase [Sphingomonas kyeonggiensis]MBB4100857.1 aryl-phospho-beta-D-glucosidase BglC (GH1 family) [Sphingomonas kyeonggiensis]
MKKLALALLACMTTLPASAQTFLRADGQRIVDESGNPVLLRGMGLGGWMLQEGYMLQLGQLGSGQQYRIRASIADLIGEEKTAEFYQAWLDNHTRKADIDMMARWGMNSVRLPMHYNLLTLPTEKEPVAGRDTWLEDGFRRIDTLLAWTKANGMYLILDLHAAPGGQGNDLPIADRDPDKPSLWQSAENRRKTVAIWRKLAERYADEPGIGAYDVLNEPNWDFSAPGGDHGCKETGNAPLKQLYTDIAAAIRQVDKRHMLIIEGNCWGNNYQGLLPFADRNTALSFHKYWNYNDEASIAPHLKLRETWNMPLWLGESGENSNVWFRDAIGLVEKHGIGWAFWPLKKIGFNNPYEIAPNPGWAKLVAYWTNKGPRPSADEAYATLMQLARHDIRHESNLFHADVVDAMLRQPHDPSPRPSAPLLVTAEGGAFDAVDYDIGPAGIAYRDTDDANYHVSTGKSRTLWNNGRTWRNDGVDIARADDESLYVSDFKPGEWMRYSLSADGGGRYTIEVEARSDKGGTLSLTLNGGTPLALAVPTGSGWQKLRIPAPATLLDGNNMLVLGAQSFDGAVRRVVFVPAR